MENPMEKKEIPRATPILGKLMKPPSPHVGSHIRAPPPVALRSKAPFLERTKAGTNVFHWKKPHGCLKEAMIWRMNFNQAIEAAEKARENQSFLDVFGVMTYKL